MASLMSEAVDDGSKWLKPVLQNLPQFLVLFGTLALVATTIVLYLMQGEQEGWGLVAIEILRDFSLAVVASGFFSWLMKTLAFKRVLREELTDILYSPKHLSAESPRLQYLENALVASGLPSEVAKAAAPIFVDRLHSPEHPYYYSALHRKIDFAWKDKAKGVVEVRMTNRYTLESLSSERAIVMRGFWHSTEKLKGMVPRIDYIRVVPRDPAVEMVLNEAVAFTPVRRAGAPDTEEPIHYEWEVELPPGRTFDVEAVFCYAQDVDDDNVMAWEAVVFAAFLDLEYSYPQDMVVHFTGIGKAEFHPSNGGRKQLCRSLILPGEGYILSLQRKQEN